MLVIIFNFFAAERVRLSMVIFKVISEVLKRIHVTATGASVAVVPNEFPSCVDLFFSAAFRAAYDPFRCFHVKWISSVSISSSWVLYRLTGRALMILCFSSGV